jgi:hypothetical protein
MLPLKCRSAVIDATEVAVKLNKTIDATDSTCGLTNPKLGKSSRLSNVKAPNVLAAIAPNIFHKVDQEDK